MLHINRLQKLLLFTMIKNYLLKPKATIKNLLVYITDFAAVGILTVLRFKK